MKTYATIFLLLVTFFLACKKNNDGTPKQFQLAVGIDDKIEIIEDSISKGAGIKVERISDEMEPVTLSVSGLPKGFNVKIFPDYGVPDFLSTLLIIDSNNVAPGIYPFSIVGKSATSNEVFDAALHVSKFNGFYAENTRFEKSSFKRLEDTKNNMSSIEIHASAPYISTLSCWLPGTLKLPDGKYSFFIKDDTNPYFDGLYLVWEGPNAEVFKPDSNQIAFAFLSVNGGKISLKIPRITLVSNAGNSVVFAANVFE